MVMSPGPEMTRSGGKKRARMGGVDKTPEGPTPRKRKPVTRTRTTLREYFTGSGSNKENKRDEVNVKGLNIRMYAPFFEHEKDFDVP